MLPETSRRKEIRGILMGRVAHDFHPCALEAGAGQPGGHSKFQEGTVKMLTQHK